jgi:hypothetical protein
MSSFEREPIPVARSLNEILSQDPFLAFEDVDIRTLG